MDFVMVRAMEKITSSRTSPIDTVRVSAARE